MLLLPGLFTTPDTQTRWDWVCSLGLTLRVPGFSLMSQGPQNENVGVETATAVILIIFTSQARPAPLKINLLCMHRSQIWQKKKTFFKNKKLKLRLGGNQVLSPQSTVQSNQSTVSADPLDHRPPQGGSACEQGRAPNPKTKQLPGG